MSECQVFYPLDDGKTLEQKYADLYELFLLTRQELTELEQNFQQHINASYRTNPHDLGEWFFDDYKPFQDNFNSHINAKVKDGVHGGVQDSVKLDVEVKTLPSGDNEITLDLEFFGKKVTAKDIFFWGFQEVFDLSLKQLQENFNQHINATLVNGVHGGSANGNEDGGGNRFIENFELIDKGDYYLLSISTTANELRAVELPKPRITEFILDYNVTTETLSGLLTFNGEQLTDSTPILSSPIEDFILDYNATTKTLSGTLVVGGSDITDSTYFNSSDLDFRLEYNSRTQRLTGTVTTNESSSTDYVTLDNISIDDFELTYNNNILTGKIQTGSNSLSDSVTIKIPEYDSPDFDLSKYVLKTEFENHKKDSIKDAHTGTLDFSLDLSESGKDIKAKLTHPWGITEDTVTTKLTLQSDFDAHKNESLPNAHKLQGQFVVNLTQPNRENLKVELQTPWGDDDSSIKTTFLPRVEFEDHLKQSIPDAHKFTSKVDLNHRISNNTLTTTLAIDKVGSDSSSITLPDQLKDIVPSVNLEWDEDRRSLSLSLDLGKEFNEVKDLVTLTDWVTQQEFDTHVNKSIPEAHDFNINPTLDLTYSNKRLEVQLTIGNKIISDNIELSDFLTPDDLEIEIFDLSFDKETSIISSFLRIKNIGEKLAVLEDFALEEILDLVKKIYNALGGDSLWENGSFDINLGQNIEGKGSQLYNSEGVEQNITIRNIVEAITYTGAATFTRLGLDKLPAKVPENVNAKIGDDQSGKTVDITNYLDLWLWDWKQMDARLGKFPVEVEIKDSDLVEAGDQTVKMEFPNLAELCTESMGLLLILKSLLEADLSTNIRTLGEAGATRTQGLVTYRLLETIQAYLNFKTKQKKIKIDMSYTPIDDDNATLSEVLKESEQDIIIEEYDDDKSLPDLLAPLLHSASIVRAQSFRKFDLDFLKSLFSESNNALSNEEDFDQFIEKVERGFIDEANIRDPNNPYGKKYENRPRIVELGNQADEQT